MIASSSTPLTYRITTLGCRVNHAETRELASVLRRRGLVPAAEGAAADLEVIHSCSVTNRAAAKSRHALRRAARRQRLAEGREGQMVGPLAHASPHVPPKVIVTGCYAATHRRQAAHIVGHSDDVLPHEADDGSMMIDRFGRVVDAWLAQRPVRSPIRTQRGGSSMPPARSLPVIDPAAGAGRHVRAELRIQDGCDAHCTFCILPQIRTTLRSKTIPDTVAEARRLVDLGHLEIVLTGIFLGAYGHETALRRRQVHRQAEHLADVLDAVAGVPGLQRLRLSSLEPGDVTKALLEAMVANAPIAVPHLHLPLQSGSDAILSMMNRQYRAGDYLEMIDRVNEALTLRDGPAPLPPAISTDVICGFPGEGEADFEKTVAVAERVGFLHMHVFPFSPRAGTAAARWQSRFVDHAVTAARVRRLIDLERDADPARGLSLRYRLRLLGRTVRVLLEQPETTGPGVMRGRCDRYAEVSVRTDRPRGSLVNALITAVTPEATIGIPAAVPSSLPIL